MIYRIDQSGKIEQTNKPTVVAISNGKSFSVKISAVEKQKLIKMILEIHRPNKTYTYQIFAALIFTLLKKIRPGLVIIDKEYAGHEAGIKEVITQLLSKNSLSGLEIGFELVGKKCNAHKRALAVFQRKERANLILKADDLLELLIKKNKAGDPALGGGTLSLNRQL